MTDDEIESKQALLEQYERDLRLAFWIVAPCVAVAVCIIIIAGWPL